MSLQNGTLVVADDPLIKAVNYALTLKYNEEQPGATRRRRSSVNDAGLGAAESSEYGGMFHLGIETETVDDTEKVYLTVDWPESGYADSSVVGYFDYTEVYWYQPEEMPSSEVLVCFDPKSKTIFTVKAGNLFVSYWKVIGKYDPLTQTVSQLWRSDRPGDGTLFSGYSGAFAIRYDKDAGTVQITGGNVSVNNTNYTAADFTGSMGESSTMYYYARHRVAQSASSGDEDPDLTEQQKQALRTTIANCDTAISTATQVISGYQSQINALVTQRNTAYSAIASANSAYNSGVTAENTRHQAVLAALDPTASDYAQKVAAENSLHSSNLSSLASTRSSAVSAQQTIISGLDSQIAALRGNIQTQQGIINTQTQTKNAACLQLYGVIPASAGVEIIGLPTTQNTSQTDQYLFIYLGQVSRATATVSGVSVDRGTVTQGYLGSIMAFYRISTSCINEL